ncbi:MAG: class I SAM-dependent methyltransferase [Candidatus Omnitrophica bacterium]|nr:class I SAM-dependent methyltransferase [Candidatus Omnitrophota bacterium]
MKFDKLEAITPTEYSRDVYIDKMLSILGSRVKSVCDVGCGVGNLLLALEDRLADAKGIDTSDESLSLARTKITSPRIRLEKKSALELDEQFDLVFLTDILEHIQDDRSMIRSLHDKVVKKNGYLIMTVPAHRRLYSKFDRNAGHYRRYDKAALLALLKEGGFEPMLCWCYGQLVFHYIANAMLLFDRKDRASKGADTDKCFNERTRVSAIREFSGISKLLVSRVNLIHRICFALEYMFKDLSLGIGYCVLCKSR